MNLKYLLSDYLLYEKEELEKIEKLLREKEMDEKERKTLKGLAEWHFQNCMEGVKQPGVPWCVQQYIFGYRKKPSLLEIQQEYGEKQEYWNQKRKQGEKARKITALAFAACALLIIIVKWMEGLK